MVRACKKILEILINLEKNGAIHGQVRTIIYNDKKDKINNEAKFNNHSYYFFNYLYKKTLSYSNANLVTYLNTISFLKLANENSKILDGGMTEKELLIALQSIENNKSPGNKWAKERVLYNILEWGKDTSPTGNRKKSIV